MKWTIYHNPRCSKSRETLQLLTDAGVELEIVEYLKFPPDAETLRSLATKLGVAPAALVRTKDEAFPKLGLNLGDDTAVVAALAKHPTLLERPIVVRGDEAVIGRPPENVRKLLDCSTSGPRRAPL